MSYSSKTKLSLDASNGIFMEKNKNLLKISKINANLSFKNIMLFTRVMMYYNYLQGPEYQKDYDGLLYYTNKKKEYDNRVRKREEEERLKKKEKDKKEKNKKKENDIIEYNDSIIKKFGKNDLEKESFGNEKSSICAYLLFYERIKKSPIHILIDEQLAKGKKIISFGEEDKKEINKKYDILNIKKEFKLS